jgi:hypothetical protein
MKKLIPLCFLLISSLSLFAGGKFNLQGDDPALLSRAQGFMQNTSTGFEENKGQVTGDDANRVKYMLKNGNLSLFLLNDGIAYQFNRIHYPEGYSNSNMFASLEEQQKMEELSKDIRIETYRMDVQLVDANPNPRITTEGKSNDYVQYYNHNALNVHNYSKVTYHDVYPNIDWVVYSKNGQVKYDFVVRPGGNPDQIKLKTNWVEDLQLNADGSISMKNRMGVITEKTPVSFQGSRDIKTQFEVKNGIIGFNLGDYSKENVIVIDPALVWATYYGGSLEDSGYSCSVDNSGNVYLAGDTRSTTGIAAGGHQNTYSADFDAFLVKFNPAGIRQWATYYGGTAADQGRSCSTDSNNNIFLAGVTSSSANISSSGHQNIHGGAQDAFLVKFNSSGIREWATYYGGSNFDVGLSCATDPNDNVYLTGHAYSAGLAISGHQNSSGGDNDAFLVKFSTSGLRLWATYYGGTLAEQGFSCTTDNSGNVLLSGRTASTNNISFQGHQNVKGANWDSFLVKFNSSGTRLWATYFGNEGIDYGYSVSCDLTGNILLSGQTNSTANIAFNGHQNTFGGNYDAFLAKFNTDGILQWSTYFGGTDYEEGISCFTNEEGSIYLTGYTASASNIALNGFQNTYGGNGDGYIAYFDPSGTILWSTYYGGALDEISRSGIIDLNGNIYIAGRTSSTSNISLNGHQNSNSGGVESYLAKIAPNCPPNAPFGLTNQIFCVSATISDLVAYGYSIQWYSASSGGTALSSLASLTSGSTYYASQTINGCESSTRLAVTVNINSLPTVPTGSSEQSFCNGSAVSNLTAVGSNILWYSTASGGSPLAPSFAITVGNTYYASQTVNSCESIGRFAVTVIDCENSLHFDGSNDRVDLPTSAHTPITTSGTIEAWIKTTNAGASFRGIVVREHHYGIFLNNNQLMSYNWTGNGSSGATTFTGVSLNDNQWHHVALTFQNGVTNGSQLYIDGLPVGSPFTHFEAATAANFRIGTNGLSGQFFQGQIDKVKIWSRVLSPTELLNTFNCTAIGTSNLNAHYVFNEGLASQTNTGITTLPAINNSSNNGTLFNFALTGSTSNWVAGYSCTPNLCPTPTGAASQTLCPGSTLSNLVANGQDIQWYATSTGGTALAPSTPLVTGSTYYASQTTVDCESANRLAVTVTINPTPAAPTGSSAQTTCGGTLANLTVTGSNIQWYSAATGGSPLASNTPLANGSTYFASQTVNGCESVSRLAVTVTSETPPPTGASTQEYCSPSTLNSLPANVTGTTLKYYSAPTGGSPLPFNTPMVNGTTYYVSQTVNGCESVSRLAVTTTVYTFTSNMTAANPQQFCNSATVSNLVASGTPGATISWFTSSMGWQSGQSPLATSTQLVNNTTYYAGQSFGTNNLCKYVGTAGVQVIINSTPAPTGSATQTFCNSATVANLNATGTGIQWYAAPTGGTALTNGTALTSGTTYYASQTASGCESVNRFAVTVTINTPSVPSGMATQTFCSGATVGSLSATGSNIQWYAAASGGSPLSPSTLLSDGTIYYASQTVNGCESTGRFAVTGVFGIPSAPTGSAAQTVCNAGTVADLTAVGSNIQWYAASTGGTALSAGTVLTNGSIYYASQTSGGCESTSRLAVTVTINVPATPTGAAAQTFCNSATVANLTATGNGIQWYAASTGGTALTSVTALTTGTTYYASQTISGCESIGRLAVTVTINTPAAPSGASAQSFCGSITLAGLTVTGSSITWYDASSGGSVLSSSTNAVNGVTYYASQTINGCESVNRLAVQISINTIPNAPTGSATQTFCNSATVANLVASGSNIQWYAASTGGTALAAGTALTNGSTYYASQTAGGCESTDRLAVTATINAPATPTGSAAQTFCNAATVADLTATGSGIQWYTGATGGTALTTGTALSNGTYYASQTISGCESMNRLAVNVVINAPAAPTGAAAQTICGSGTLADLTVSGSNITWYDAASAGTVLGAGTALADGVTYYATQTISSCESINRLAVTVEVNAIPAAPTGSATQEFCNSATIADLSATGTAINWYPGAASTTPLISTTAVGNGAMYFATQTVNGCESTDRLQVTVTINAPAAPTGIPNQDFCFSGTVADLDANGQNIQWYNSLVGGGTTPLNPGESLVDGFAYQATQTINGCESQNQFTVTVGITTFSNGVSLNGATLTASATGASYQWIDCNDNNAPISGATTQTFTPAQNGNYAVVITVNGCSDTSACVAVTTVGLDDIKTDLFRVYPNPASTVINVEMVKCFCSSFVRCQR